MNMPFSRRNTEKLGFSRPPPDIENDDSGLGFLRDDIGSGNTDYDLDRAEEQPRTQSVLSMLSWGDDEFERESTREVERMLEGVDRLLFEGEADRTMPAQVAEECRLWSRRFPHLRVVGRHVPVLPGRPPDRAVVPVSLLTADGPVDEDCAACLRSPGREETICAHGLGAEPEPEPEPAPQPQPAEAAVADPAALIAEMVANSLVSQLWSDYVRGMTPVFQLGAESAESMRLTSVSREASARARRHSDPGQPPAPAPPPPPPAPPPPRPAPPPRPPAPPASRPTGHGPENGFATVGEAGRGAPRRPAGRQASRERERERRLPALRGAPPAGRGGGGAAPGRAASEGRSTLPRISPSTETTRQLAPTWSRHQGRRDVKPKNKGDAATTDRSKPQPAKAWGTVSSSGWRSVTSWHR